MSVSDEDDEEDDFFDAVDEQTEEFKVCLPPDKTHKYALDFCFVNLF